MFEVMRQPADVRRLVFAFEIMLVLPRGLGPSLRELLPANITNSNSETDEDHVLRYRNQLTSIIGAENVAWLATCTKFAREFRETMARETLNILDDR
jgi:uncharacterized protein YkwD